MTRTEEDNIIKVNVINEWDEKIHEWRAVSTRPKFEAVGVNAGQSVDRINSLLKKHFDGEKFLIVERIVLPKPLQDRVDALHADLQAIADAQARCDALRLPLAKDLQQFGLLQKQAARLVQLSPTWLGNIARTESTATNNARARKSTR